MTRLVIAPVMCYIGGMNNSPPPHYSPDDLRRMSLLERYRRSFGDRGQSLTATDSLYYNALCGTMLTWRVLTYYGRIELGRSLATTHRPNPLAEVEDNSLAKRARLVYAQQLFASAYDRAYRMPLLVRDTRLRFVTRDPLLMRGFDNYPPVGPLTTEASASCAPGATGLDDEPAYLVRELHPSDVPPALWHATIQLESAPNVLYDPVEPWITGYLHYARTNQVSGARPDARVAFNRRGFTCSTCLPLHAPPMDGWCHHIAAVWAMLIAVRMPRSVYASMDYYPVSFHSGMKCYLLENEPIIAT